MNLLVDLGKLLQNSTIALVLILTSYSSSNADKYMAWLILSHQESEIRVAQICQQDHHSFEKIGR